jgi:hypothetical protein
MYGGPEIESTCYPDKRTAELHEDVTYSASESHDKGKDARVEQRGAARTFGIP